MITLHSTDLNKTITLPNDLSWTDEFSWGIVAQKTDRTLQGDLIIEESVMIKGRPISLEAPDDMAWIPRSTVEDLHLFRNTVGAIFTLTLSDARAFTVRFNQGGPAFVATPILSWKQFDDTDWYKIALKFLEV